MIVTVPLALRPMTSEPVAVLGVVVNVLLAGVVVVAVVPRITMFWFAAAVGDIVALEDIVGVKKPPRLSMTAAGAFAAEEVVAFVATVLAATVGVSVVAAVVGVVVTPEVIAALVLTGAATATPPTIAPPPPLVTTGVGGELIELFTVISGFAVSAGYCSAPVW